MMELAFEDQWENPPTLYATCIYLLDVCLTHPSSLLFKYLPIKPEGPLGAFQPISWPHLSEPSWISEMRHSESRLLSMLISSLLYEDKAWDCFEDICLCSSNKLGSVYTRSSSKWEFQLFRAYPGTGLCRVSLHLSNSLKIRYLHYANEAICID